MRLPLCHCLAIAVAVLCGAETKTAFAQEPTVILPYSHLGLSARQETGQQTEAVDPNPSLPKQHLIALRLGPSFQNRVGVAFGLDITPPRWNLAPDLCTRLTLEGITLSRDTSGSLGDIFPIGAFTLEQVYQRSNGKGFRPYIGAGVGIYSGSLGVKTGDRLLGPIYHDVTVFGGKLLLGADFTSTTGVEAAVHFAGSQTLGTLQLRLKL